MAPRHPTPLDDELTHAIIGSAMRVHRALGPGFLESVYHRALEVEFRSSGILLSSHPRVAVRYRGEVVGEFIADFVVDGRLIVEVKAIRGLGPAHGLQLVNYLTATGIDTGLLLNFGGASLQVQRKVRVLAAH